MGNQLKKEADKKFQENKLYMHELLKQQQTIKWSIIIKFVFIQVRS